MFSSSPLAATLNDLDTWVIDQSPAALYVCSAPAGEIIRYNALAVRLWGRAPGPGERVTGAWRTFFPDGNLMHASESPVHRVLAGGTAVRDRHMRIERPDGSSVEVTAFVSPLQDDGGHLVGAITAFEEVTGGDQMPPDRSMPYRELLERHLMLRETDAALHSMLDAALIGLWDYDLETGRAVRSITHDQIHGYPEAIGDWTFDTFLSHVAPEHRDAIRARFAECKATGGGEFDCRIIRADGSPAWIWSRGRVVHDAHGAPRRIVGVVMDVTRHKMEQEGHALERQRQSAFVSTLAHELRQPLAALLAAVEVVRLARDEAAISRATGVMKRQISQMNRVVEDVIDAVRWARGKVTLKKARIDLRDVIREAVQDVGAAAAARGHDLVVEQASEPLWADADPQRLHQVLANLLRNAVKYTDPGGHITLTADRNLSTATIRVRDTGRGIDPAALPRIFDMFAQVQPSEGGGLGIGLSVVREIVALHAGRIEARSAGPGHGSEFIVTLPVAPPPAPAANHNSP